MTSGGADALKAAIRRSVPLVLGLMVLGIVAVNVFRAVEGPSYEASVRVLLTTTPLSNVVIEAQGDAIDPERVQETGVEIAESSEVYERAAAEADQRLGEPDELDSATEVSTESSKSDLITFTSESSDPDRAVAIANAVASAYVDYRDELFGGEIDDAIEHVRSRLEGLPPGSPARPDLVRQLNTLELLDDLGSSDAEPIASATSASQTSPALLSDSMLGLSIGLLVALMLVAVREAVDTTVRSEAEVEDLLSAPVIASVQSPARGAPIVAGGADGAMLSDAYALLAAQLEGRRHGEGGLVLAVTSAGSQEGKTATAANLAVAAARRGTRVLLADFDLRNPALAEAFEIADSAPGTLQAIAGSASLESAVRPVGESLELLPSGGTTAASGFPERSRLAPLLAELRGRADLVILDTPPALHTAGVAELSHLIDTVLVVVRERRTSQRSLHALRQQAGAWPAELAGVVMTGAPIGRERSRYYGGG